MLQPKQAPEHTGKPLYKIKLLQRWGMYFPGETCSIPKAEGELLCSNGADHPPIAKKVTDSQGRWIRVIPYTHQRPSFRDKMVKKGRRTPATKKGPIKSKPKPRGGKPKGPPK